MWLLFSCSNNQENQAYIHTEVKSFFREADAATDRSIREKMTDSAYAKLQVSQRDTLRRKLLFNVASRYEELGAGKKSLAVRKLIYTEAKQQKDTTDWAQASSWIGDYYQSEMQIDSAFKYYLQSEKMYRQIKDTLNYSRAILKKSTMLYHSGNFPEGINQAINALKMIRDSDEHYLIYSGYTGVASSLKEIKDYTKALEYFNLAFAELGQMEKQPGFPIDYIRAYRATYYNNMGTTYERLNQYSKAIDYYNQGLQVEMLYQKWPELYAALLSNLAYAKMKSGSTDGVEKLLLQSFRVRDSIKTFPGIISSKIKIGEFKLLQKDTAGALENFRQGFELSRKIKASAEMLQTLKLLTENNTANKDYYSDLYFRINDSVQNVERATQNKFARIAYETEQIQQQNQMLSRRNKIIIVISAFVLFVGLSGFLIYRLRVKNKELRYTREQQEANEQIYQLMLRQQSQTEEARNQERNRIAMELHDGIVNNIFTTRFNLMQLDTPNLEKKGELVRELEKTEQEIRKVSHDLQQSLFFEDQNLPQIIEGLVRAQQNDSGTEFDLSVDKYIEWQSVSDADKIHVYRIIQEALQNVNKYANAQRCLVMLFKTADSITIRIWDNGAGFNTEKAREGIGLKNIRMRTEAMGGKLNVTSSPGNGTTIEVVF